MWSDRPSLGLAFSYNLVPADGFLVILMILTRGLIDLVITELPSNQAVLPLKNDVGFCHVFLTVC
jgi:hypothetical protein